MLAEPPMRWVWPFSWWYRIRDLELHNAALKVRVRELESTARAREAVHTLQVAALVAGTSAIASTVEQSQRRVG